MLVISFYVFTAVMTVIMLVSAFYMYSSIYYDLIRWTSFGFLLMMAEAYLTKILSKTTCGIVNITLSCIFLLLYIRIPWNGYCKKEHRRKETLSKWNVCVKEEGVLIFADPDSTAVTAVMNDGTVKMIYMEHPVGMYLRRRPKSGYIVENEKEMYGILA